MITLHESNITSFPHDNGIGVLSDAIKAYAEEELNGLFEFYMEYDSEGHLVDELKEERIIKAKAQDKLGYQLFRIYSITKNHENDNLIVKAQHITYDLADNFVESLVANNLTKKQVMELIGASTVLPHPFNVTSSNNTTRSSTRLYRTNPLQMIAGMEGSVLQIWGGQIERDNFNLILHDRRGSDDGVKVTYEKNITGLEATFDISGLVTRIFPFVYIEESDNSPARLITVSGKYIDSPLINNYEKIYIKPIDYSSDERINTDGTDVQIRQQLTNIASQYFNETGNDKIKVDMEVQFEHLWETEEYKDLAVLELVGMGDTVTIEHSRLKVDATAIVNYIRYDCIAEKNEEVRLGSVKARLTDNVNKTLDVVEKVEQAQQTANQAIRAANGKNTIYYGPDEPEGGIEGDLWFRVVDGEYTRTYRHDGIQWQLVLSVDVRDAIDEAQQAKDEAQQAVDRANQATQQATNAINQAQTAFDEAQAALSTASNAYDIATTLQGDVVNLSTLVDDHTGQISSITQSVGNLTTRIGDAEGNITTLQQTSSSLAARLTDAEGNITTLTATVDGLQTTVSDVQGNVSNLTVISNAMQARLTNAEGDINELTLTSQSLVTRIGSLANPNLITHNLDEWTDVFGFKGVVGGIPVKKHTDYVLTDYSSESVDKIQVSYGGELIDANVGGVFNFNSADSNSIGFIITSTDSEFFRKLGTVYRFKLEEGTESTAWTAHDEDIYSQYSQLQDAINLRVQKGDVINQINISDESILIDGKRIHITGQTTIDDAAIKSAHIQSLDGGKITAGSIDAGKLSVTELSAISGNLGTVTAGRIETLEIAGINSPALYFGSKANYDGRIDYTNQKMRFQADNYTYYSVQKGGVNPGSSVQEILHTFWAGDRVSSDETILFLGKYGNSTQLRSANDIIINTIKSGGRIYLEAWNEIRCVRPYDTSTYTPIRASAFNQSSSIKYKTHVEELTESALDIIDGLKVVEYFLKDDFEAGKQVGFIAEESKSISTVDGMAINTYKLTSYNTKAIQELDSKFTNLEDEINWLKLENQYLRQKIEQLEGMVA